MSSAYLMREGSNTFRCRRILETGKIYCSFHRRDCGVQPSVLQHYTPGAATVLGHISPVRDMRITRIFWCLVISRFVAVQRIMARTLLLRACVIMESTHVRKLNSG